MEGREDEAAGAAGPGGGDGEGGHGEVVRPGRERQAEGGLAVGGQQDGREGRGEEEEEEEQDRGGQEGGGKAALVPQHFWGSHCGARVTA